ncbi:MAG: M28 family metallopeptidase [Thermoplasmatota archaeon]
MKWLVAMLAFVAVAGCIEDGDGVQEQTPVPEVAAPAFNADVAAAVDWFEQFSSGGKRDAYVPDIPGVTFNQASRDVIADTLRNAGGEVQVIGYAAGALGLSAPDALPIQAWAVEASWPGSNESLGELGLIAHYDTQAGTIVGAYDNGSGTAVVVHTCIELSTLDLRRDLTCVLFDAEEIGTVASRAYVADTDRTFDLVMGFDMVGLNCDAYPWKLYGFVGANFAQELFALTNTTFHNAVGDCATVFDFNDRNSDEASFASAGIPTVRFAGGRSASDYDQYHLPDDTVEHLYELTGGRANWESGFGDVMRTAYDLAVAFDQTTIEELAAA